MNDYQVKQQLDRYFNQKVHLRGIKKEAAIGVWKPVVDEILKFVKQSDGRFDFREMRYGGSFYERTKTKEPNEFDVMVEIPSLSLGGHDPYDGSEDNLGDPPTGYTTVMIDEGEENTWIPNGCIQMGNMLSATMLKSRFAYLANNAIREKNFNFVSLSSSGPAVKLSFRRPPFEGSVDLTLAIKDASWPDDAEEWKTRRRNGWPSSQLVKEIVSEGCYLVANRPPNNNSKEADLYWLYSFSQAEKKLSSKGSSYQSNSCRRKLHRILKTLREEPKLQLTPLTSYHLKTIMLYECEAYPQDHSWSDSQLVPRFKSALERLLTCLRNKNCPHYFIPSINLFDKTTFNDQRYQYLTRKVSALLNNPVSLISELLS